MAAERTEMLRVRTSPEEMDMLRALAAREGLSSSDVVRLYIRRAYAATFGGEKPKTAKEGK